MRFRFRRSDAIGIEIAPLIDIVFILLIFFVVTSTFIRENTLEIVLPESQSDTDIQPIGAVEILVSADNEISIDGRLLSKATTDLVAAELVRLESDLNTKRVLIRADAHARHETVVFVLDAVNLLGLTEVSIVTVQAHD